MISRLVLSAAAALFAFSIVVAPQPALAQTCPQGQVPNASGECVPDVWGGFSDNVTQDSIQAGTGLGNEDPRAIAARVINVILGFLGIIAVILILAGGFMWMTAAGNEDKIAQAKKVMSAGVIGLVIVLAAFGIAQFVVNALVDATTGTL